MTVFEHILWNDYYKIDLPYSLRVKVVIAPIAQLVRARI